MWFQIILSIPCLLAYVYLGQFATILLAPLVAFLILSKESKYFPALIIHSIAASTMSYFMLLLCIVLAILLIKKMIIYKVDRIFYIALCPAVIMLGVFIIRLLFNRDFLVDAIMPMNYTLGLFPFFYGVAISDKINVRLWKGIIIVLFICVLFQVFSIFAINVRLIFFIYPLFVGIVFYYFFISTKGIGYRNVIILSFIVFIIAVVLYSEFSLTILLSILFTCLGLFFNNNNNVWIKRYLNYKTGFVLLISLVLYVFIFSYSYESKYKPLLTPQDSSETINSLNLKQRVLFKLTSDRLPLWVSAAKQIIFETNWLPPLSIDVVRLDYIIGKDVYVDFGAHNLLIEVIRVNGIIVGIVTFFIYINLILKGIKILKIKIESIINKKTIVFALIFASAIGAVGFFGAMFGQFPLFPGVSFALLSFCGISYGYYYRFLIINK